MSDGILTHHSPSLSLRSSTRRDPRSIAMRVPSSTLGRGDATELAGRIQRFDISAEEACEATLAACSTEAIGAFWELDDEGAFKQARAIDGRRGRKMGPLAGVPFGVKDCFDVANLHSTYGVRWRDQPDPASDDAHPVALLRGAGAIPIGKTAMHQLAWGMSGQAPGFPPCRNPFDPMLQPGGSSSGSAAAVGAGLVPIAIGTDAGGSVRQPAAWCGVVGFKPTIGAISLSGCAPMSPSLDTFGVFAQSVRDCRSVIDVLVSHSQARSWQGAPRVGVLESAFEGVDPAVDKACRRALSAWANAGAVMVPVDLSWEVLSLGPIYGAEFAAAWGTRVDEEHGAIGQDVRTGIVYGRTIASEDYLATVRALGVARRTARLRTREVDVVACPTTPTLPPPLDQSDDVRAVGRNTRIFNALGWPALSLPCGWSRGGPLALMIAAPSFQDLVLLDACEHLEGVLMSDRERCSRLVVSPSRQTLRARGTYGCHDEG